MEPEAAYELEVQVLAARAIERHSWVVLAERLAVFHESEAWRALGWDKFTDWLGVPEVGMSRRTAYRLVQAWKWAGEVGIGPDELGRVDLSKLAVIIPAVKDGRVGAQEAISDAEMLSRSDLAEKWGTPRERPARDATEAELELCPDCAWLRRAA